MQNFRRILKNHVMQLILLYTVSGLGAGVRWPPGRAREGDAKLVR